ncbi:MAG: nitronate monooxygenase [Alphaproteobacteria bacterium]|nr:nitronate monooxygenase [Alphaproteobacteria bacterium]
MTFDTALTRRLGLRHPLIQAPLAGGGDTPALVSAVCEAGAFGSIGATYLTPAQIADTAQAVRSRTNRPFGINLFAPLPVPPAPDPASVDAAVARLIPYHVELGLPPPTPPAGAALSFDDQFAAALESGAAVFSFTFGLLPAGAIEALKRRDKFIMGTATTVAEARALERSGVDAIIAQGAEAGGQRGSFADSFESSLVGTMALVPQMVDAVRLPVIAAGGIMDGRGAVAALALGAGAVQLGTAFLACDESGVPEAYKQALLAAQDTGTRLTRAFSGRPARGIVNRVMADVDAAPEAILPFPLQNALTRPMRAAAAKQDRAEFLSLWAGQGVGLARRQPAADLIARLVREMDMTARGIAAMAGEGPALARTSPDA